MKEVAVRANVLRHEAQQGSLEHISSALKNLGFGANAAGAFCAIAKLGEATAADLVVETGIPDSKIYYALDELAEGGLVEVQSGKPRTYRAVPSHEVQGRLTAIVDARQKGEMASVARLVSLLEPLRPAPREHALEVAYIVKGMPNVLARMRSLMSSARRDVLFMASDSSIVRAMEEPLLDAARRGVRLRLAIPTTPLKREIQRVSEMRTIVCNCGVLVVDGLQVLTISNTGQPSAYGITSTDETLVRLALDYWDSPRCCT